MVRLCHRFSHLPSTRSSILLSGLRVMTFHAIAVRDEMGTGDEMRNSILPHLFKLWNHAAENELGIRVNGPRLTLPEGTCFELIYDISTPHCELSCRGCNIRPCEPADVYACSLNRPAVPGQILKKYLTCVYKQLGQKPAWHGVRDIPTEIITYDCGPSSAPGLQAESVWAQYWFNQHHHLSPRPILRWHPAWWPEDGIPFKKLKIRDCTDRPYFGLNPELVGQILDLTGRVKRLLVHDGLFHPSTPTERDVLIRRANTVTGFRP